MSDIISTTEALLESRNEGHRDGYRVGEMERIALATANTDLRSEVLSLKLTVATVYQTIAAAQQFLEDRDHDTDHRIYLALQTLKNA